MRKLRPAAGWKAEKYRDGGDISPGWLDLVLHRFRDGSGRRAGILSDRGAGFLAGFA